MFSNMPWLLPFWLLGAPLVAAIIDLMRTRRDTSHTSATRQLGPQSPRERVA
jgi:hypothetical protein